MAKYLVVYLFSILLYYFFWCMSDHIFVLYDQKSDFAGHVLSKEKIYIFAALYHDKGLETSDFCLCATGLGSWLWLWHWYPIQEWLVCVFWLHSRCSIVGLLSLKSWFFHVLYMVTKLLLIFKAQVFLQEITQLLSDPGCQKEDWTIQQMSSI